MKSVLISIHPKWCELIASAPENWRMEEGGSECEA